MKEASSVKYKHMFKDFGGQGNKLFAQVHKICLQQELRDESPSLTTCTFIMCLTLFSVSFKPKEQYSEEGNLYRQKAGRMLTTLCQSYHVL